MPGWSWAALFILTVSAALAGGETESLAQFVQRTAGRQAYGVYMLGQKVGWSLVESRPGNLLGQPVAVCSEEDWTEMVMMGERTVSRGKSVTYYTLTGEGAVLACQEWSLEDGQESTIRVQRCADGYRVERRSPAGETVRIIGTVRDNLAESQKLEQWLARARPGEHFSDWSCDFSAQECDNETRLTFRESQPPFFLLQLTQQGARGEMLARSDGSAERISIGSGVELRAEVEAQARKLEPPREMLDLMMVQGGRELGEARTVRGLTMEVEGLDDFPLPESHRQRLRREDQRLLLVTGEDLPTDMGRPLPAEERARYLASTPETQVDSKMRELARRHGRGSDPRERAERLKSWVFHRLEKTGASNAFTAKDVLHNRAGDCTEHSLLLVALLRAAGIPAREVGGLAYARDGGFAWHAWAEFHDSHHWVSADPTWDELPVDGTHIKLSNDPRDLAWINLVGRLKLKVVEVDYF
ncbi:transglutaminase domain-containing protein [bacterium CPR1]|nr:transglutaminase domain-containing protein [bacterium CPR1]